MKILVVGAGIAGPTLAYWLTRAGHQTTLLERAPELRRGGYLIDFWGAGFDVAERMGIVPELRRRGHVFTEVRMLGRGGRHIASMRPAALLGSDQRYVSIARSDLAAVILDSLGPFSCPEGSVPPGTADGHVELLLGDTVAALDDDGHRVRATFESGQVRDFDLVVGADGLHSRVRRLTFGPDEQFEKYLGIVVAAFEVRGYGPRNELVAMMHAGIGFQVLRVSLPDDRTLFLLTARHDGPVPTDDRAAAHALLRRRLAHGGWETPAILDLMPHAETFYFDAVSQIRMPSWSRGRVALVGDAAACPSLLVGQGSALAMVEAYTLAAELSRCRDHREAFARYHRRLAPLLGSKQDAAAGLGLAFAPTGRLQLLARNTFMMLMSLPKVGNLATGKSFRDAVELPDFVASWPHRLP